MRRHEHGPSAPSYTSSVEHRQHGFKARARPRTDRKHKEKLLLVFEKDKLGPRIRMGDTTKFVVRLVAATLDQTIQSTTVLSL
jgi:hypothetical protein